MHWSSLGWVVASIGSVQVGAAFAKGLFGEVSPLGAAWLRLLMAALILVPITRPWRALPRRGDDDAARRWALLAGFTVSLLTMNIAIYLSISRIPIGVAVTCEFLGPLGVAVAGIRRRLDVVWPALAAVGVLLLGLGPGDLAPLGVALALLAAAAWAGYIVVGSRIGEAWRGMDILAIACLVGAVGLTPVALALDGAALAQPRVLGVAAVVGLLSTVLPYTLELRALQTIPPAVFGILMSLEPAAAALAALVVLGERLRPLDLVAMACVIIASMGSSASGRRRARRDHPVPVVTP